VTLTGSTNSKMCRTALGGVGALYSLEVPCMHSGDGALHKPGQIDGRGLLSHDGEYRVCARERFWLSPYAYVAWPG
jgi:hypothetical protein